jgi:hypothetical protein
LLPLVGIALAGWLRSQWPLDSMVQGASLIGVYLVLLFVAAGVLGIGPKLLKEEWQIIRGSLRK